MTLKLKFRHSSEVSRHDLSFAALSVSLAIGSSVIGLERLTPHSTPPPQERNTPEILQKLNGLQWAHSRLSVNETMFFFKFLPYIEIVAAKQNSDICSKFKATT